MRSIALKHGLHPQTLYSIIRSIRLAGGIKSYIHLRGRK
jgi:hypothetical protein